MRLRSAAVLAAGTALAGCAHAPAGPPADLIWQGHDTGNTLSSENDCKLDLNLEVQSKNGTYLSVNAQNHSEHSLFIAPMLAKIEFTGGIARVPSWAAASGLYEVPAGGEIHRLFSLPTGSDFESHDFLQVTLPVKDQAGADACEIHSTLVKGSLIVHAPHSSSPPSNDRTVFDIFAGAGLPLSRGSNLRALGGAGPTFELMATYFFSASSGISLLFGTEGSSSHVGSADLQAPALHSATRAVSCSRPSSPWITPIARIWVVGGHWPTRWVQAATTST